MKAEKKPVSADLVALSMTCDGDWRGMAGMGNSGRSGELKG